MKSKSEMSPRVVGASISSTPRIQNKAVKTGSTTRGTVNNIKFSVKK